MEAAEVVQLFVAPSPALWQGPFSSDLPRKALKSFARVVVQPGQHQMVELLLSSKDFQYATSGATPAVFSLQKQFSTSCCDGKHTLQAWNCSASKLIFISAKGQVWLDCPAPCALVQPMLLHSKDSKL